MATQGNSEKLTEIDIRMFLRDNDPDKNLLLDDYEFTPEEIRQAATYAVDYYNEQPPHIDSYDWDTFPYRWNLLQATAANLLRMASIAYMRNDLDHNSGGMAIRDQNKYKQYDAMADKFMDDYKKWVRHIKISRNTEQGFGIVG